MLGVSPTTACSWAAPRAFTLLKLGQIESAMSDYNAALRHNPKLATALYGRGLAHQAKGEVSTGAADLAAAIVLKPSIAEEFARYGIVAPANGAAASSSASPLIAERRIALVIGDSGYQAVSALPNPKNDANGVAEALKRPALQACRCSLTPRTMS
jgi:tetratricopeptide (TPR) repeat protein